MPHPVQPQSPVPHRSHIAVLQYLCDQQIQKRPALGHIFAALRSEITRLGEIISAAPVTGFAGRHAVWIETLPDRCIHGLKAGCCATCVNLSRSGKSKQRTSRSNHFQTMGERRFTRCLECGAPFMEKSDGVDYLAEDKPTVTQFEFCGEDLFRNGSCKREWLEKHPPACESRRVEPKSADALSLLEYADRHRDDEAATLPHLPNVCNACQKFVTVLHDSEKCVVTMLAEQKAVAEMQAARREAWKQRHHAALIAQGLYSPEAFDVEIIRGRKGTVEADAITRFDRDLSRKGNKYRIQ